MRKFLLFPLIWLCLSLYGNTSLGLGLDDLDKLDQADQQELLEQAKRAAHNWRFGDAEDYLDQARNKAYSPNAIAKVENILSSERNAYRAEQERKRQEEEQRRIAEEQQRQAQERALARDNSGNKGGSLTCSAVSGDYGLWQYCDHSSCDGFSSDYGLWQLCENNDPGGLASNYSVWSYLQNGSNVGLFSGRALIGAQQNAGSFADRKRFVIYYLRGYVFTSY